MTTQTRERLDPHNTSVDTALAGSGLCAEIDLATGRRCRRPARHHGPCEFVPPPATASLTASERAELGARWLPIAPREAPITGIW